MKIWKMTIMRVWMLVAMATCFFALTGASAAASEETTTITQTKADEESVTISWERLENAYGYDIFLSTGDGIYQRLTDKQDSDVVGNENTKKKIGNLTSGSTYYVVVKAVYNENGTYRIGAASKRLQVVTSPSKTAKSVIRQIGASPSSIKIKWDKIRGANRYIIYLNDKKYAVVKRNIAYIRVKAGSNNNVQIIAANQSNTGFRAKGTSIDGYDLYAAPKCPKRLAVFRYNNLSWQPTVSNHVTIGWTKVLANKYDPTGYQMEIYSLKNKKLKSYDTRKTRKTINIAAVKNRGFKVRVRAYVKINGKKCFGNWTDMKTVIPEAKATMQRTGRTAVTLKWEKVKNAVSYSVYACNDIKASKPKWKKVAVVGAGTTSYKYKSCIWGRSTAMYVIPNVRVKGKSYKASYTWHLYMDIE